MKILTSFLIALGVLVSFNCASKDQWGSIKIDNEYLSSLQKRSVIHSNYIPLIMESYKRFVEQKMIDSKLEGKYVTYVIEEANAIVVSFQVPFITEVEGGGAAEFYFSKKDYSFIKQEFYE